MSDVVDSSRRDGARGIGARRMVDTLAVAVSVLGGLIAWQLAVTYAEVPNYVLPKPLAVLHALIDGLADNPTSRTSFWFHLYDTMKATVAGFLIGSAIGARPGGALSLAEPG